MIFTLRFLRLDICTLIMPVSTGFITLIARKLDFTVCLQRSCLSFRCQIRADISFPILRQDSQRLGVWPFPSVANLQGRLACNCRAVYHNSTLVPLSYSEATKMVNPLTHVPWPQAHGILGYGNLPGCGKFANCLHRIDMI